MKRLSVFIVIALSLIQTIEIKAQNKQPIDAIYILLMLLVPFAFQQTTFLVLIPLGLGLFEGVIHVAGIKIHKLKKYVNF